MRIDINCDLGESFGVYEIGRDEEVLSLITSANVACGFHGGDPLVMERTLALAKEHGVSVGAHPGFPDLAGFGRRNMHISAREAKTYVQYQIGALMGFCIEQGMTMQHVKPHGALYNMACADEELAHAVVKGVKSVSRELIMLVPAGSTLDLAAQEAGLSVAREVFADRAYEEDGSLVSRHKEGAMITDEGLAINRVLRMIKEGKVEAVTGNDINIQVDSVCVHGDNAHAPAFVQSLRRALGEAGIEVKSLGNR